MMTWRNIPARKPRSRPTKQRARLTTPAVSAAPNFFDADVNAATAPPALPPGQMTGWQREVALPASSFARGVVSTLGLPGDAIRITGAIGGAAAEQAQNPDPLSAMQPPAPLTATPGGGPRILTNQLMFDAPGKPNLPAASWHNPLDTESLLGYPGTSAPLPIRRACSRRTCANGLRRGRRLASGQRRLVVC